MPVSANRLQLDELLEYARQLAKEQTGTAFCRRILLKRQVKNDLHILNRIYCTYLERAEEVTALSPAVEWLLDNHYLLLEQYEYIQRNFSPRLFRRLPVLTAGPMKGFHRIYAIIYELLRVTGGKSDLEVLVSFLWAYQQVRPLTLGELWAVPPIWRLAIFH